MRKRIEHPVTGCDLSVNPFSSSAYADIIFDIVYLNGVSLTRYPLKERRNALHRIINPIERRFEIHSFTKADSVGDIETELRKIVAEGYNSVKVFTDICSSEGLVVKVRAFRRKPNVPRTQTVLIDQVLELTAGSKSSPNI